jgi:hypothetical protein
MNRINGLKAVNPFAVNSSTIISVMRWPNMLSKSSLEAHRASYYSLESWIRCKGSVPELNKALRA